MQDLTRHVLPIKPTSLQIDVLKIIPDSCWCCLSLQETFTVGSLVLLLLH